MNDELNQLLGFGPGNQSAPVAKEDLSAEFDGPKQMLERLALSPAPDQIAQRSQFRFGQFALKLEIKLQPFLSEDVGEQMLGIQSRLLDLALLEIAGA